MPARLQFLRCTQANGPLNRLDRMLRDKQNTPRVKKVNEADTNATGRQDLRDWNDLRYILALRKEGTMANAARRLKTNATTVSRHIKQVSEDTRSTLFSLQKGGRWKITPVGRKFLEVAERCEAAINTLDDTELPSAHQSIVISTVDYVSEAFLIPKIDEMQTSNLGISLSIETDEKSVSLAYGEADMAIRLGRPKDGRLIVSKLGNISHGIYAPDTAEYDDWIGLPEKYDETPEMQLGHKVFGKPPKLRLGSFNAILDAAQRICLPCVGPDRVMQGKDGVLRLDRFGTANREVWSAIHETRRQDYSLEKVRGWARSCFEDGV